MSAEAINFRDQEPVQVDRFEIPRQFSRYEVQSAQNVDDDSEIAFRAQQIHGRCYVEYGYFNESGLAEDGRLIPELDGTRGRDADGVSISYLLTVPRDESTQEANATLRLIDPIDGISFGDLPTLKYARENAADGVQEEMQAIIDLYGKAGIREVAALASEGRRAHSGSYELMRAVIQNEIIQEARDGSGRLFIMSLTAKSIRPVIQFAGEKVTHVLGEPLRIFKNDPRAAEDLSVVPALVAPHMILENIADDLESSSDPSVADRLTKKLFFLTDGLNDRQMGVRIAGLVRSIKA